MDKIAATGLPVIVGPIYEQPKESERYDAVYSMPAQLAKRGVKIAFASYERTRPATCLTRLDTP